MRTTVDIQDELLSRAKAAASAQRRRLSDLVNDALHEILEREARASAAQDVPYRMSVHGDGGTRPGVDVGDNGCVLDAMDEERRDPSTGEIDFSRLR